MQIFPPFDVAHTRLVMQKKHQGIYTNKAPVFIQNILNP